MPICRWCSSSSGAALLVTVAELAGVVAGAKLAHSVSSGVLKKMVSVVCIVVGAFIFVRALLQA